LRRVAVIGFRLYGISKDKVLARNVKMYLCQRYTGKKLKKIGLHFGIGESGVSQACKRVAQKTEKDKKLKKRLLDWKTK
jgi:chromosomal replication initiation ATPase DnaA